MSPPTPPTRLGRGPVVGAFAAVVVAGLLGGTIGAGLVNVSCEGDCGLLQVVGAVLGAAAGAGGVAVVAVLVLRAMHEWETYQARAPRPGDPPRRADPPSEDAARGDDGRPPRG